MHRLIRYGSVLLAIFGLLLSSGVAEAHVLKENNGYSAVMHIDPDDNPEAGQETKLNFLLGSQAGGFIQTQYSIKLAITADGHTITQLPVDPVTFGDAADAIATYTFPKADVYTFDLTGKPLSTGKTVFHMQYLVRVTSGTAAAASSANGSQVLILSAGSLVILVMVGYTVIRQGKRYTAKPVK